MHRLLRRQLRRHLDEHEPSSEALQRLLAAVSEAYAQADVDRGLLERSLELMSQELLAANAELRADVEARKRVEEALRQRETQTRAILAALPDILLVVAPSGELREVHAPARCFLPEPRDQLVGRSLRDVLPDELHRALVPAIEQAAVTGVAQRCELTHAHGRERWRYEARLTVSPTGDVVMAVAVPSLPAPVSLPRDVPVGGGRRVLIIDDDPLVASSLRRLLASREVQVADSGRRGIEMLRQDDAFEVVLCDLMMPEISGMDVYETVLEERPDLADRFIFMTGGAFTERARTFLERVPNPRLEKPFDGKTLRMLVSVHGGR